MIELLSTLSLSQILLYAILILFAVKEGLSLKDFFKQRADAHYNKSNNEKKQIDEILEEIKSLKDNMDENKKTYRELLQHIEELQQEWLIQAEERKTSIKLLIKSDRDAIKSFIVKEHHYFMEQGWIDDFSLDIIERRFATYQEEGGNSYACDLVKDLRDLPNRPPQ